MSTQTPRASRPPSFASLAHDLRDHIIEHYERIDERIDTPSGLRTLDTNSTLAADRGRLLLRLLAEAGAGSIAGRRVLDLGAGFGALSLYCAHLGAEVVAVDPNEQRMQVAVAIAAKRGLDVSAVAAQAQQLPFADESFDVVLANNSLCYIVDPHEEAAALSEIRRVLRPGGWLVARNPNRLHPRDQFTGLPLLPLLSPALARRVTAALERHRSDVRLHTPGGAVRGLRRAGFARAQWRALPGHRFAARFAGYHHVIAQRPEPTRAREENRNGSRSVDPTARQLIDSVPSAVTAAAAIAAPSASPTGALHPDTLHAGSLNPSPLHELPAYLWMRRHWEAVTFGAIAVLFVWMRLIDMRIGFWDDEAATVVQYIDRGPAGIYSSAAYSPNDHILYSLLSWMTINILGRSEPIYRIWSIGPAILSAVLLLWWTRQRLGRHIAFALAGILLTAPYLLYETIQARGYGLAQLGMVLVLIAAIEIEEHGPRRWSLWTLGTGIVIGPASHAMTAVGVLCAVAFLLRRRDLRKPVGRTSLISLIVLAIIVGPLVPAMVSQARTYFIAGTHDTRAAAIRKARPTLPPSAPLIGPINLGAYTGQLLETGSANTKCTSLCYSKTQLFEYGSPLLVCALLGAIALWWRRRRAMLGCLVAVLVGSYLLPTLARVYVADRFALYLLPAYALLAAIGLGASAQALMRQRWAWRAAVLMGVAALSAIGFLRIYQVNEHWGHFPPVNYKGLAEAYRGTGIPHAITNVPPNIDYGLTYYLGDKLSYEGPAALERELCGVGATLAFVQLNFPITATERSCLEQRHASSLDFPGASDKLIRLWLIQAPGKPAFAPLVTGASSA
jgi:SAM-dependent methyltransferase/4-amino-4-deoxy-L-arabinose transferase-like glycosyltransferase